MGAGRRHGVRGGGRGGQGHGRHAGGRAVAGLSAGHGLVEWRTDLVRLRDLRAEGSLARFLNFGLNSSFCNFLVKYY